MNIYISDAFAIGYIWCIFWQLCWVSVWCVGGHVGSRCCVLAAKLAICVVCWRPCWIYVWCVGGHVGSVWCGGGHVGSLCGVLVAMLALSVLRGGGHVGYLCGVLAAMLAPCVVCWWPCLIYMRCVDLHIYILCVGRHIGSVYDVLAVRSICSVYTLRLGNVVAFD